MIFVGKRAVGKTHRAVQEVVCKCKSGDVVGVISYNKDHARFIKKLVENKLKSDSIIVEVIGLNEMDSVNHILIDELDRVLGDKCVCSSGGVVKLDRDDEKYLEYEKTIDFDKYTYREENNRINGVFANNDCNINSNTTFGCGCHVVGDFTVKGSTKTTGKDYLKKLYTKEQIIGSIKGCPKVFNNGRKVSLPKDLTKYSKDVLVEILFTLNELEFLQENCKIFEGIEKINKLIEEEEKVLYYIHSKRIAELELELDKIIKEIELTPKECVKHKVEMLNKKNEVEIKLAELRAEI